MPQAGINDLGFDEEPGSDAKPALAFLIYDNCNLITGRVLRCADDARGFRATAVVWLREPSAEERAVVLPCLIYVPGVEYHTRPLSELEPIVATYRRIWERLPKGVRDQQMGAMKCWSPRDFEVMEAEERTLFSKLPECYRTARALLPKLEMPREGTHHNALDDARFQARYLMAMQAARGSVTPPPLPTTTG